MLFVSEQIGSENMYRDPIGHRIKTLNNLIKRAMDRFLGPYLDRATLMHIWIIGFLQDREDLGLETFQKDIENEFSINRSTTSEMLKLMSKKGMIERVPVSYDARLKKIVLSKQSKQFNEKIEMQMKIMYDIFVQTLTQDEINEFMRISDKLIDNVKECLERT